MSLILSDQDIDDFNWYQAKDVMKRTYAGRETLKWVENNLNLNSNFAL
jgi:hypothetical protein